MTTVTPSSGVRSTVGPVAQRRPAGSIRRAVEPLVYLSPILVLLLVFIAYPVVRSIWLSFSKATMLGGVSGFVGLDNFVTVVTDGHFAHYLDTTAKWTFGAVALQFLLGLIGALLLNGKFPFRGTVRGLLMVPWATPSVLVALIWLWLLDPNHGLINALLLKVGAVSAPVEWLSDPGTALPSLIMVDVWQGVPFFAVMILAALQGVSGELKESARVDGATAITVFRHVVLPSILPTILITLLLRIIWTANYVDLAFILTGGGPAEATTTLPLQSYLTAYKSGNFGVGASYAVIQAAVLMVFIVIYVRLSQRGENS
jgi:multiple sugar transport system permease protein